jgi:hypothetical protein
MYTCPNGCNHDFKQYQCLHEYWTVDADGKWIEDFRDPDTEIEHIVCEKCGEEAIDYEDEEDLKNKLDEWKEEKEKR